MAPAEVIPWPEVREARELDGVLVNLERTSGGCRLEMNSGGTHHICSADPAVGRRIRPHLLGATLRLQGAGTWVAGRRGGWRLTNFTVADFRELPECAPMEEVVRRLRAIPGSGWSRVADPAAELRRIREGV